MKAIYMVLPLSLLLITSACEQPDRISKEENIPKTEAVQEVDKIVINSEDPKFKALEPYGPKDPYDSHVKYTKLSNPEYMEMKVFGGVDNGHYIEPFSRYSLFKQDDKGVFNIIATTNYDDDINRLGVDRLQCWNNIIYKDQVKQAVAAVVKKIKDDYMEDDPQLIYANGIGVVEKPSDAKMMLPIHLWTEWKDTKKNRTLGYEVILEKDSKDNWGISSIEQVK